jgi:hypothetical protein
MLDRKIELLDEWIRTGKRPESNAGEHPAKQSPARSKRRLSVA